MWYFSTVLLLLLWKCVSTTLITGTSLSGNIDATKPGGLKHRASMWGTQKTTAQTGRNRSICSLLFPHTTNSDLWDMGWCPWQPTAYTTEENNCDLMCLRLKMQSRHRHANELSNAQERSAVKANVGTEGVCVCVQGSLYPAKQFTFKCLGCLSHRLFTVTFPFFF